MTNQQIQTDSFYSMAHLIVSSHLQELDKEEIDEILYTHTLYPFGSLESIERDILTYKEELNGKR
jgi:hypothetical protein